MKPQTDDELEGEKQELYDACKEGGYKILQLKEQNKLLKERIEDLTKNDTAMSATMNKYVAENKLLLDCVEKAKDLQEAWIKVEDEPDFIPGLDVYCAYKSLKEALAKLEGEK